MSVFKDPAMQAAHDELVAVLQKHDLMGGIVFCSKARTGWAHFMSPSWSCLREEGDMVKVRSKRADYPTQEAQNEHLALTVGGLMGMANVMTNVQDNLAGMVQLIGSKVNITHVQSDMVVKRMQADMTPEDDRTDEELTDAERVFVGLPPQNLPPVDQCSCGKVLTESGPHHDILCPKYVA